MKKVLYSVAGFVGFVVAALFIVPTFVSFDVYKPLISTQVEKTLGRRVHLDGNIYLSLLPRPSLVVEKVRLENPQGASSQTMVDLPKMRLDMALLPLLHRQVRLTKVQLFQPNVNLEILSGGQGNWVLPLSRDVADDALTTQEETSSKGMDFDLSFDKLEILNANIHYKDALGKVQHLEDLTTNVSLDSLTGPLEAQGVFKALGKNIQFYFNMKKIGEKTPMKLTLTAKGVEATLKGDVFMDIKTFQGNMRLVSDLDDLEKTFEFTSGAPEFLRDPFTMTGYIEASPQGINVQHIELDLEGTKLEGGGEMTLSPLRFSCDLRGLPGGAHLKLKGTPDDKGLSGFIDLSVPSPRKLLKWTRMIDDKSLPPALADRSWDLIAFFRTQSNLLEVSKVHLKNDQANVQGNLSYVFEEKELKYDLNLYANKALLKELGFSVNVQPDALSLSGQTRLDKVEPLTLTTQTRMILSQTQIDAKGEVSVPSQEGMKMELSLSGVIPKNLALGEMMLHAGTFSTVLKASPQQLTFKDFKTNIGVNGTSLNMQGDLELMLGQIPTLEGQLTFAPFALDALLRSEVKHAQKPSVMLVSFNKHSGKRGHKEESKKNNQAHANHQVSSSWSKSPLNLSFLKSLEANLVLKASYVAWDDLRFENVSSTSKLKKGRLETNLSARLFEGDLKGAVAVQGSTNSDVSLKLGIDNASVQRILSKVDSDDIKVVKGNLDALLTFKTFGSSMWDFVNNLEGPVSVDVLQGVVSGIDLKNLSQKLKNVQNIAGLTDLFSGSLGGGQTAFSEARLAVAFNKGIGRVGKLSLLADGATVSGGGTINLPDYKLDITSNVSLTDYPEFPPFSVRLSGPINDPQKSYDLAQLQGYMLTHIFKGVMAGLGKGGSPKDILSGLLGGGSQTDPDASSQKESSPDKGNDSPNEDISKDPAKAIGGLLKGLL